MKTLLKILLNIILLFLGSLVAYSQDNQIIDASYLTSLEKEVVKEINFARMYPHQYSSYLVQLKSYYVGKLIKYPERISVITKEGVSAVEEAIRYLRSMKKKSPLRPSKGMSLGAKDHVLEQGPTGKTGHHGKDGSQCWDRVNRYGAWNYSIGENISYGRENARKIVMMLIIDDDVPGRGHRKTIFEYSYNVIGVAIGPHTTFRTMCVITFAGEYKE